MNNINNENKMDKKNLTISIVKLLILLFIFTTFSCTKSDELNGNVQFWLCSSLNSKDTIYVKGETYLFNDFILDNIKTKLVQEYDKSGYASWMVYEDINELVHGADIKALMSERGVYKIATLHVYTRGEIGRYYICNYPDFAKEWKVPSTGQKVSYEGKALLRIRQYGSPMDAVYDLGLTILKTK